MIKIIKGDVFDYHGAYTLVHCISADCVMGAGIAKEVKLRFPNTIMSPKIVRDHYGPGTYVIDGTNKIIHLITKYFYYNKPEYPYFELSLLRLKYICKDKKITKLVLPKIGCGLDKLDWKKVLPMIEYYLKDVENVIICIKE